MTCYDTKDNAGLYRFIPDSKTITIIVVSFLFYTSYFTGIYNNLPLRFSLTDTAVKNRWKYLINMKEWLLCLFSVFSKYKTIVLRCRLYFMPVRAKLTICFEKLMNHSNNLKKKFQCYFEKLLKLKAVQLVTLIVEDYVTCGFTWNDLWTSMHACSLI